MLFEGLKTSVMGHISPMGCKSLKPFFIVNIFGNEPIVGVGEDQTLLVLGLIDWIILVLECTLKRGNIRRYILLLE